MFQAPDHEIIDPGQPAAGFSAPEDEVVNEKTLAGFGRNAVSDVVDTVKGVGGLGKRFLEHPVDTTIDTVKAIPGGLVNEGKRLGVGELLTGHPINAADKFLDAAYDKPVTTAMEVIPAGTAAVRGMRALTGGAEAARAAELAAEAGEAGAGKVGAEEAAKTAATAAPEATATAEDLLKIPKGTVGKSATMEAAEDFANNPPKPPPVEAPQGATSGAVPGAGSGVTDKVKGGLKEVYDYVNKKYGEKASKPQFGEKVGQYLKNEVADLRAKDIGMSSGLIKSMGPGFEGIQKAEALMDYAAEKGYFDPKMTDVARKNQIIAETARTGREVGAIRDIAGTRGKPPIQTIFNEVKTQLQKKYGIDAPNEIKKVLAKIKQVEKEDPTFSGYSDLSTKLNHDATPLTKMGQHTGPTTDAANIISRLNNDAIRSVLNQEESQLYTKSLRDFGAHKKLEQAVSNAGRRAMGARSNQRGIMGRLYQEALDRGGYRIAGNVADRMGSSMIKNPERFKTLPQFFEEFAHHSGDVLDEALDFKGMAHGGVVPGDVARYVDAH